MPLKTITINIESIDYGPLTLLVKDGVLYFRREYKLLTAEGEWAGLDKQPRPKENPSSLLTQDGAIRLPSGEAAKSSDGAGTYMDRLSHLREHIISPSARGPAIRLHSGPMAASSDGALGLRIWGPPNTTDKPTRLREMILSLLAQECTIRLASRPMARSSDGAAIMIGTTYSGSAKRRHLRETISLPSAQGPITHLRSKRTAALSAGAATALVRLRRPQETTLSP